MKTWLFLLLLILALGLAGCASAPTAQPTLDVSAFPTEMQGPVATQAAEATITAPCKTHWSEEWVEAPTVGGIGLQLDKLIKDQPGTWEMSNSDFQELVDRLEKTYKGNIAMGTDLQVPLPISNSGGDACDGRVWNLPEE